MDMDFSDEEECEDSGNISYEEDNDEGEDDGFVEENDEKTNEITNSATTTEDLFPFTVLPTEAIVQHMTDSIRDANSVLQLPATTMRILLNHFGWDKEKLMEVYYGTDQEELFRKVHLINPNSSAAATQSQSSNSNSNSSSVVPADNSECGICCLQIPSSRMYVMKCGHRFCGPCWNEYLTFKIMEESMGQTIACAAHNCPILMDDAAVMKLLTDPQVKLKYQHHITYSFVHCNRLMRWCPSPDCKNAVRVQYNKWQQVACHCNYKFCFQCGDSWHDPVKCSWLKKWIKKCNDDSETSHWISANTKDCPKCNAIIEKNGGCNHMTCTNVNCKQEFCWVCLGQWESYAHNCNRYNETDIKAAKDAKEKSRAALERYLFYCNRYMNHMQSLKFENKLYDAVNEKMEEIQQHMSWIEAQFLKKAVDILCQCRQTLMYTYVFAFYVVKSNQSAIFEDNQQDLESTTEKLSEFLERDITSESISEIKQKVQNLFRYCETRRKVLIDHVHEGYDQDWWTYNDC